MAVVNKQAAELPIHKNAVSHANFLNGKKYVSPRTIAITNGDTTASTFSLGKFSSRLVLHPSSIIYHNTIAGLTNVKIGIESDDDALIGAVNVTSGSSKNILSDAKALLTSQPLWQLLGLENDPYDPIELIVTLGNDAAGDGNLCIILEYANE